MENASKALIIAGAILLSILLISLGIMIFTQAQDVVTGSGMTEAQISSFNQKFLKYEGTKKGTLVKSLIQDVKATNANEEENDGIMVLVNGVDPTTTANIINNNTYDIELIYADGSETGDAAKGTSTGRVKEIKIYKAGTTEEVKVA